MIENTALNALGAVFDRGGIVLLTAMLSGSLSAEAFRDFGQFQLTLTMLASFSSVGLVVSISRLFAEHDGGRSDHFPLVGTMWLLSVIASVMLGLLGILFHVGGTPLDLGLPPLALLAGLIALTMGLIAGGGVLGLGLFRQGAVVSMITAMVLLGTGAWAVARGSLGLAATALVAAYAVNSLLLTALVLRRVSWRDMFLEKPFARQALRKVGSLVGPLAVVTLLASSANWILGQLTLLRAPDPTISFAGLIIGLQWFALVQFLPGLVGRALFPDFVKASYDGRRLLRQGLGVSVLSALMVAVGVAIFAPWIAAAYDPSAVAGGWILVAFAVAALPQSIANLVGGVLVARRLQHVWALLSLASYVILIVSAYVLGEGGAFGMAAALAASGAALAAGSVIIARRRRLL